MSTEPVPNSAEPSGTWGTVQQASAELGISERAVIKRISNGTLHAVKEDRQWRVLLPDSSGSSEPSTEPKDDSTEPAEPSAEPIPNDKDRLITELQEDVAFLRSQLQQRDVAESEFRRLLLSRDVEIGRLQERVQLLLAAPTVEDAAQDDQEGRSAKVETNAGISALEVSPRPKKWFEFWRS